MYIYGVNAERAGVSGFRTMVGRYSRRRRNRFWEIDFVRGICVLLMVFDHFMYCLWDIMPAINEMLGTDLFAGWQDIAVSYWMWGVRINVREAVILTFFILCGVSCTLTRGNFRRSIPLALIAAGISVVTGYIDRNFIEYTHVIFGVIHMIACGVFAYALLDNAVSAVAAGRATITLTDGSAKGTCVVIVKGGSTGTSTSAGTSTGSSTGGALKAGAAVVVNGGNGVFVRSGPGTSYEALATVSNGASVQIVKSAGDGWYQITFAGSGGADTTGYMKGDYLANS